MPDELDSVQAICLASLRGRGRGDRLCFDPVKQHVPLLPATRPVLVNYPFCSV